MTQIRWNWRAPALALLIGTMLVAGNPVRAQSDTTGKAAITARVRLSADDNAKGGKPSQVQQGINSRLPLRATFADLDNDGKLDVFSPNQNGVLAFIASFRDSADETLGATLQPVSESLRAQLNIPAGQGLLVASLKSDGPSAQAGLKQYDVLLTLADKPLAAPHDLTKQLKTAGEKTVPLKILRAGKPITLQVRPVYQVTLGPVEEHKTEFYLGVSIAPLDDALRAQLALPSKQGVIVSDVTKGSPAEKAGVKKHDIVLELGDKKIDSLETLATQVQTLRDKPVYVKVLHGQTLALPIKAEMRKVDITITAEGLRLLFVDQGKLMHDVQWKIAGPTGDLLLRQNPDHQKENKDLKRIEELDKELKALRQAVEKLNEVLKTNKTEKHD